ncbi:hypothetical protein [Persicobacter psychrovividus]|uniref:Lipoprotein n=1 Tax=Persicobacter psychrovividus TaxID=387638 RepID=A0ABN6L4D6_9BACT|nr:hypothetical protein PEPS_00510 [Persicobacter psychrovividus]
MNTLKTILIAMMGTTVLFSCTESKKQEQKQSASTEEVSQDATSVAFDQSFDFDGQKMVVHIPNTSTGNKITITPEGFENMKEPYEEAIEGIVREGYVADLDQDGYKELYLFEYSQGSGAYGQVRAYASYSNKSFGPIYMPELSADLKQGYMGHDRFVIEGGQLVREFPIYNDSDTNAKPTGGMRTIKYRLEKGEAGMILKAESGKTGLKIGL